MAAHLSDEELLRGELPASWAPLLEGLAELAGLLDEDLPPGAERRAEAAQIRSRLIEAAGPLLDEPIPDALKHDAPEHRRWFAEAVLLWLRFADIGATPRLDTLGTEALERFPVDLESKEADRAAVRAALGRAFGWRPAELAAMDRRLDALTANLRVKKAVTAALAHLLRDEAPGGLPEQAVRLFRSIYGPLPLRPGDVDVVVTGSALYFALAYRGLDFLGADFDARPDEDRAALTAFLVRLRRQNVFRTRRFPSFGLYDPARVDAGLLRRIGERVRGTPGLEQLPDEVLLQTFHTMPSILPRGLVEQYLLHDAWGHGWQESLCEFEWLYGEAAHIGDPVDPETGGAEERLADAFVAVDGRTELDPATLDRVVEADLRRRIRAAGNTFLSEVFADLVEHKYVRQVRPDPAEFPTSSLLPDAPLKLDLSLGDARLYARAWSAPYRRLIGRKARRARLAAQLAEQGAPRAGLAEAVRRAADRIAERFDAALRVDVTPPRVEGDRLVDVGVVQRLALAAVSMDAELERFLAAGERTLEALPGRPRWCVPEACVDLLVLTLAWFYEQDHDRTLWHLDELLRSALEPGLRALGEALRAAGGERT